MKALVTLIALAGATAANAQTGFTTGSGQASVALPGLTLNVFTYKPANCTPRQLLVVFHGLGHEAAPYLNYARPLADRFCAALIAPEYDAQRFPTAVYQHGGSTIDTVLPLVDWARAALGQPAMPYDLIGHSAGAQFLSRVAAYGTLPAAHIVIANPSTWVMPNTSDAVPYGFGGMANAEQALRGYLARPVVALLGTADTGSKDLSTTRQAMAQGATRIERGRNAFAKARAMAQERGWAFGWTLVEVPGVGHSASKMFGSAEAAQALGK